MPFVLGRRPGSSPSLPLFVPIAGLVCALVPLLVMAACRSGAARAGEVFMGEIQYDQFYYLAAGRAIHERGNGFAYPNPYDDDPASPLLYSHLYPLLVGWIFRLTPLSNLQVDYLLRILGGIALAVSLWRLVSVLFEDPRHRRAVFWIVLLAGGGVWIETLRRLLASGASPSLKEFGSTFGAADIEAGWWFPNVFRNFFYATETLYHAIAFRLLYALASGRGGQASLCLALLLYAHPLTGIQFAAIAAAWAVLERLSGRPGLRGLPLAGAAAALGAFAAYYFVWLPRFPAYLEIVDRWRRAGFFTDPLPYLWTYAPWLFLLPLALWAMRSTWLASGPWRLLVVELAATAALMNNHWFLGRERPLQPLHFSRGYEFLPMALLVLAWLLRSERARPWLERPRRLLLLLPLLAIDNLAFLRTAYVSGRGQVLPAAQAEAFERVCALRPPQTILCNAHFLSYLFPTFSPHRVVLGHLHLIPEGKARVQRLVRAIGAPGRLFEEFPRVTLLVAAPKEAAAYEGLGQVGPEDLLFEIPGVRVYRRPAR